MDRIRRLNFPVGIAFLAPLLSAAAGALLLVAIRRYLRCKNDAGISTSLASRSAQVGSLVTRSIYRRAWLRVRQILASRAQRQKLEHEYHLQTATEAARMMGNMKGVFMKLGQIASFATNSVPEQAQKLLQGLQKDAPPMAFHLVRGVIESELGADLSIHFRHVDEEPLAAASIGQVHRARLHTGEDVVLKVQYPGVDTAIENDLKAASGLAFLIGSINKNVDANAVVAELKDRLLDELDYRKELKSQELFGRLWEGHPLIRIPRVYPQHSAKRVLCQEYKKGLSFYDFLEISSQGERRLATFVLHDFVFDSMHLHHVFNGDPHPGNYLFHEDGGVTFLDFGCIKYFPEDFIGDLRALSKSIVEQDRDAFDRYVRKLGLVLEGRPYDRDLLWNFFAYHASPFARDETFTFTTEWVAKSKEVMDPKDLQQFNLPPNLLFFNRITFGLNAIFQKLGASANFHQLTRRYLYEAEAHPPALARAGVEMPEKFLPAHPRPAAP